MFRCPITGKVSAPGEKPVRVVLETRARTYYNTPDGRFAYVLDEDGNEVEAEVVGTGTEIVREVFISREGLAQVGAK